MTKRFLIQIYFNNLSFNNFLYIIRNKLQEKYLETQSKYIFAAIIYIYFHRASNLFNYIVLKLY
jgi:hypothetical protein